MPKPKADHCVMDMTKAPPGSGNASQRCAYTTAQHIRCDHCGETFPMPLGSIPWVTGLINLFVDEHRHCKPQGA